ncbi:FtsB family cell division protein [Desulfotomaculum copahuensis]|uniref:Cell division protein FtsL n=1 Tax=Desulfotomaculum copahuensis TaxID=1838280 RepID=A0A1B7LCT5_9FIRM|nr:septum formation initiator family protein [Desulfotomaculum copahuensis]OAT80683.1 hypothetical protein A6M21_13190 [Desulfotomaculum copahuensis]
MISPAYKQTGASFPGHMPARAHRHSFSFKKSRLPLLLLVVMAVYLVFSFVSQFNRLFAMQRDLQQMQQQVNQLQQKNNDLRQQLSLVQSNAYIEQVARERLGLVKPGETRIVPVQPAGKSRPAN